MKREKAYIRLPILLLGSILITMQGCSFEDIMHLDSQQLNEYQPEETDAQTEEAEDDEVSTAQDTAENVSEMYYGYYGLFIWKFSRH